MKLCNSHDILRMDLSDLNSSTWLLSFGCALVLFSASILVLIKRQRDVVLTKLLLPLRLNSEPKPPSRPSFPESTDSSSSIEKIPSTPSSTQELVDIFPPSRRSTLLELANHPSSSNRPISIGAGPSLDTLQKDLLPTTESYDIKNDPLKYTPTGFSTAEIRSIGDFPPYDILSGVPLPAPYDGFDYKKALPRPYRPFRWAYHQTMCMSSTHVFLF